MRVLSARQLGNLPKAAITAEVLTNSGPRTTPSHTLHSHILISPSPWPCTGALRGGQRRSGSQPSAAKGEGAGKGFGSKAPRGGAAGKPQGRPGPGPGQGPRPNPNGGRGAGPAWRQQQQQQQPPFGSVNGAGPRRGEDNGGGGGGGSVRSRILHAAEWRQLAQVLSTPDAQPQGGDGGGGEAGGVAGGGGAAAAAGLGDGELLLALWRIACGLLTDGLFLGEGDGAAQRQLPPSALPPPPLLQVTDPTATGSLSASLLGAPPPWVAGAGGAATGTFGRQRFNNPAGEVGPVDDLLRALDAMGAAAAMGNAGVTVPAAPLPPPLHGSTVARQRALEAALSAVQATAPRMGVLGLAAALRLLACAALAAGADAADVLSETGIPGASGVGAMPGRLAAIRAVLGALADPFLAAAEVAAPQAGGQEALTLLAALPALHRCTGAVQQPPERQVCRTHAVLDAALAAMQRRAALSAPPPYELAVAVAAAAGCAYLPERAWLGWFRSEFRNQSFVVTAGQAALALDALEALAAVAGASAPAATAEAGAGGASEVLPADWCEMMRAEMYGKAAAAASDVTSCTEAVLELAWYGDAGLLLPLHAAAGASARLNAGAQLRDPHSVRHLYETLCAQLAAALPSCGGRELAALLPPLGRLARATAASAATPSTPSDPAVPPAPDLAVPPNAVPAADLLLPATDAVLRLARGGLGGLTWPQLAACVVALGDLAAPSWVEAAPAAAAAASQALEQQPSAVPAGAARDLEREVERAFAALALAAAQGGATTVGVSELAWLPGVAAALWRLQRMAAAPADSGGALVNAAGSTGPTGGDCVGEDAGAGTADGLARRLARDAVKLVTGKAPPLREAPQAVLHLVVAVQHPWTSGLFISAARRDVLLALLSSPPPARGQRGGGGVGGGGGTGAGEAAALGAAAAAAIPGVVTQLGPASLVAVLRAAAARQARVPRRRPWEEPPADPWVVAAASVGLARLLQLLTGEHLPGFMDAPRSALRASGEGGQGQGPEQLGADGEEEGGLSAEQLAAALAALAAAAPVLVTAPGGALTPAALLDLLQALERVWPQLPAGLTADVVGSLAALHQCTAPSGIRTGAVPRPPGPLGAGGGGNSTGVGAGPSAADWHVVQRAVAAAMPRMTSAELAAAVTAAARMAGAVPLCDDWMAALTEVLLITAHLSGSSGRGSSTKGDKVSKGKKTVANAPTLPPVCSLGADVALEMLAGCVELKAAAPVQERVMLPVLPLLETLGSRLAEWSDEQEDAAAGLQHAQEQGQDQSGEPRGAQQGQSQDLQGSQAHSAVQVPMAGQAPPVPCAALCRLLPRLALLGTDPFLATILGAHTTPLLSYMAHNRFAGASAADLAALAQGLTRLLLRPGDPWVRDLCAASLPLLHDPATPPAQLAALAQAMASAWLVPTQEWHTEFCEVTRTWFQSGVASRPPGERVLDQLLWAQALWATVSEEQAAVEEQAKWHQGVSDDGDEAGAEELDIGAASPSSQAEDSAARRRPLALPPGWLEEAVVAAVPLLPQAQPAMLSGLPYSLWVLGHDPGPDFIAGLLQGASARLASFTGPQLSRLAAALPGLGYQPEDPWVARLQRAAASRLGGCAPHELVDCMEGVVLLAEGTGEEQEEELGLQSGPRVAVVDGSFLEAMWAAGQAVMERDTVALEVALERRARRSGLAEKAELKAEWLARTRDPRVGPMWQYWAQELPFLDPNLSIPDEDLLDEALDLSIPADYNAAWAAAQQQQQEGQTHGSARVPGAAAAAEDADAMPRLTRYLAWAALRRGRRRREGGERGGAWDAVPADSGEPWVAGKQLPEGIPPYVGLVAVESVALFGGRNLAAATMNGALSTAFSGSAPNPSMQAPPQAQQQQSVVPVAPPRAWLSTLSRCQKWLMLQGVETDLERQHRQQQQGRPGESPLSRQQLLAAARAAAAWGEAHRDTEWAAAFLEATAAVFFEAHSPSPDPPQEGKEEAREEAQEPGRGGAHAAQQDGGASAERGAGAEHGGGVRRGVVGAGHEGPLTLDEALQLCLAALALELAPPATWLAEAEAATLGLLRGAAAEDAIALALALQRLATDPAPATSAPAAPAAASPAWSPGRPWCAALLAAASPAALAPLPPASTAALLGALAGLRVRPGDGWMEGALAALHDRHAALPAPLRPRLLASLARLDVSPAPAWLGPAAEAFWAALPDLLPPPPPPPSPQQQPRQQPLISPDAVEDLVAGLAALSALGVPVKQAHLTALVGLLGERLMGAPPAGEAAAAQAAGAAAPPPPPPGGPEAAARVLVALGAMQRATPGRVARRQLDALFAGVAERLPVAGPATAPLLDAWDSLVPVGST